MTKPFLIAFAIHTAVLTSVGVSGAHAQATILMTVTMNIGPHVLTNIGPPSGI